MAVCLDGATPSRLRLSPLFWRTFDPGVSDAPRLLRVMFPVLSFSTQSVS